LIFSVRQFDLGEKTGMSAVRNTDRKIPKYSTWTRRNRIAVFALIVVSLLLIAVLQFNPALSIVSTAMSIPFIYITFVLLYTYYQFSASGGNYQSKIHDLIVGNMTARIGKLLDVGSGSGSLIIKAAKALPQVTATGIDYWGNDWGEYSQKLCETNAQIEGVADRVKFIQGSASRLPFADSEFDIVISCLTFHEVKDERHKVKLLSEALRVLKSGGEFVFLDLFLDEGIFGNLEDLINQLGVARVETAKLEKAINLPRLLLLKQCLGYAVIITGKK
jgi:SAM-dependent methyltransferase